MDLAELANRVDTIDVLIAVIVGIVVWAAVNAIGLVALTRFIGGKSDEDKPSWSIASAQAGLRLLATLLGIVVGAVTVWLIAL